jgi:hypothetical protein
MSEMWVAVSCGYGDAVFSHRAVPSMAAPPERALRQFNRLLDESANCVRSGLAGWLGPQTPNARPDAPLSEHEKLREIEKIMDDAERDGSSETVARIRTVLCR